VRPAWVEEAQVNACRQLCGDLEEGSGLQYGDNYLEAGTRTARAQPGASGALSPSRPTTTRMPFGGSAGHGVYPSVSTTVTAGRGRSAAAAAMPAPMSVPAAAHELHLPGRGNPLGRPDRYVAGENPELAG